MPKKIKSWDEWDGPEKEKIQAAMQRSRDSMSRMKKNLSYRPPKDPVRIKIIVVVLACMLSLGVGGVFLSMGLRDYQETDMSRVSLEATIISLERQLEELQAYEGVTREYAAKDLTAAEICGDNIAALQDRYLSSPPYTWVDSGKMTEDEWNEAYTAMYEDAQLWIEPDTGNQGAWYLPPWVYVDENGDTPFYWRFEKLYNYTDSYVPMVWTCWREDNGALIAYASGRYSFEDNKVQGVEVHTTAYGQQIYEEINDLLLTYDWEDITEEERQQRIASMEADMEFQDFDVESSIQEVLDGLGVEGAAS